MRRWKILKQYIKKILDSPDICKHTKINMIISSLEDYKVRCLNEKK